MSRLLTLICTCLLTLTIVGHAFAAPELPGGSMFQYSFTNWEGSSSLTPLNPVQGDIVYGLLDYTGNLALTGGENVRGVFLLEVGLPDSDGRITYSAVTNESSLTVLDAIDPGLSGILSELFFNNGDDETNGNREVMRLFGNDSPLMPGSDIFASQSDAFESFVGWDGSAVTADHFVSYSMDPNALGGPDFWVAEFDTDEWEGYYGLSVTSYLDQVGDPDFFTYLTNDQAPAPYQGTQHEMVGDNFVRSTPGLIPWTQADALQAGILDELFPLQSDDPQTMATPEPGTLALLGGGLLGAFAARRRRKRQAAQ